MAERNHLVQRCAVQVLLSPALNQGLAIFAAEERNVVDDQFFVAEVAQ